MKKSEWKDCVTTSYTQTVKALLIDLNTENYISVKVGLSVLMQSLATKDKNELKSHLRVLMAHIIKWNTQPDKRTRSWVKTIRNARNEIDELLETEPSMKRLVKPYIRSEFPKAKMDAEDEMEMQTSIDHLTYVQVMKENYTLPFE